MSPCIKPASFNSFKCCERVDLAIGSFPPYHHGNSRMVSLAIVKGQYEPDVPKFSQNVPSVAIFLENRLILLERQ